MYLIVLEEEGNFGSPSELFATDVPGNGEGAAGLRFPDVLLIVVVLGSDDDLVGDQVSGVETNTELTDHADVSTGLQCFHEFLGARPRNGTQIVHQI